MEKPLGTAREGPEPEREQEPEAEESSRQLHENQSDFPGGEGKDTGMKTSGRAKVRREARRIGHHGL